MTTSIRIRRDAPHEAREQGGLVAAFVGNTQYVPAGSIEIEIQADDVEFGDGRTSVGWVEDVAPVAAAAFRHADTGEQVGPALPQAGVTIEPGGIVIVDDAAKEEEVPFPEAGDPHPFGSDDDTLWGRAADAVDEVLDSAQGDKDGQGIITHLVNRGFLIGERVDDLRTTTEVEADRNAHNSRVQIVRRKVVSALNAYGADLPAEATAEKIMVEIQGWIR